MARQLNGGKNSLFYCSHPSGSELVSYCGLIYISHQWHWPSIFMCLLAICMSSLDEYLFRFFFNFYFLIEGQLLYRILLFSVKPQPRSTISVHISPPFGTSLPSPSPSHPSRLIQSSCLSFLSHIANSCWLSILHMVTTPWTAAYQAPPSMGFSRQEHWSGVPLPSPM